MTKNSFNKKVIQVVAGVIFNSKAEVLVSYRTPDRPNGGYWEFPGGKVEKQEAEYEALKRELQEELGIQVDAAREFFKIEYNYEDLLIELNGWLITKYNGYPHCKEGQKIKWIQPNKAENQLFAPANLSILMELRHKYHLVVKELKL